MSLVIGCERKITHKCRYRSDVKLIIIAHDYSETSAISTLSSAINDVSLIWNLFRRHYCFNKSQVFIYGRLNLNGKNIPWKERCDLPISLDGKIFFYYSGHGYPDGRIDINPKIENLVRDLRSPGPCFIIDSCYSHRWNRGDSARSFIGGTGPEKEIAISTRNISGFTLELTKTLLDEETTLDLFREWILSSGYTFECEGFNNQDDFRREFLN